MKRIRDRLFICTLIAAMILTIQEFPVLAETVYPENRTETSDEESENQTESSEGESESPEESSGEESEDQTEPSEEDEENQTETSEDELESLTETLEEQIDTHAEPPVFPLSNAIVNACTVHGQNPPGVIVNLFDYWQDNPEEAGKEVAHDYYYDYWDYNKGEMVRNAVAATYNLGISRGHLLRFGYTDETCNCCEIYGQRGAWNMYRPQTPYSGIVKNRLGSDGFPVLNLAGKASGDYGQYYDTNTQTVMAPTEESLAYLFSPYVSNSYKASYRNVQGLFQKRADGSYYYNSRVNFASYNRGTNSFILYNSPGVAKAAGSGAADFCGQFFPFNSAQKDVFNTYTDAGNGTYRLAYQYSYVKQGEDETDYSNYNSISDGKNGYIQCYAPNLNHYLGMTIEMQFLQPENGCLPGDGTPMVFAFSGDDDVWIFIDGVLVADLGGLHDACSLKIDFSTGAVEVQGAGPHTLLDSFQAVYGNDANPGGIAFNGNTFTGNTVHTLKMFYLERGHMASNLSLDFNIQTLPYDLPPEENGNYPFLVNTDDDSSSEPEESIVPETDKMMLDSTGIPQTGDDSLLWWWAALCFLSLLGIGAVVGNLIVTRGKKKKYSSKK